MECWAIHTINAFFKGKGMEGIMETLHGEGKIDYNIAIPSYDRVETLKEKTIALLEYNGIPKDIVNIFVANEKEYNIYKESFPDYKIIKGVKGLMKQRNFMTQYFSEGQPIVYMDDDIMEVKEKVGKEKESKTTRNVNLKTFLPKAFDELRKAGLYIWGLAPVLNPFYMTHTTTSDLRFIIGNFYGVINRKSPDLKLRFATDKEDVERTLRFFKKDGGVLRFNYIAVKTRMYAPGGLNTEGLSKEIRINQSKERVERLLEEFPGLGTSKQRPSGVWEFVFKRGAKLEGGVAPKLRVRNESYTDTEIYTPAVRNPSKVEKLKVNLLEVLRKTTIPPIPQPRKGKIKSIGNKLGTMGRTITLGFGNTRAGIKQFKSNKKHPELLKALIDYGNAILPKGFEYTAITLNEGVKAKRHIDSENGGVSYIIGIGDFTGGNIRVWNKDGKNPKNYDLKDKPIGFNGGLLFHQTTPFKGERYTIIYYNQKWQGNIEGYKTVGSGADGEYERLMDDGAIFA